MSLDEAFRSLRVFYSAWPKRGPLGSSFVLFKKIDLPALPQSSISCILSPFLGCRRGKNRCRDILGSVTCHRHRASDPTVRSPGIIYLLKLIRWFPLLSALGTVLSQQNVWGGAFGALVRRLSLGRNTSGLVGIGRMSLPPPPELGVCF